MNKSKIPASDRARLRELARRHRELAYSPHMEALLKQHWALNNDIDGTYPVIRIETDGIAHELAGDGMLTCASAFARNVERRLLYHIRHYELTGDDRLIPKTYQMEWFIDIDPYGFPIEKQTAESRDGKRIGYRINHAIKSLRRDFDKLKPLTACVDRPKTIEYSDTVNALIGDIIPVEMVGWPKGVTFLTRALLDLMSLEDFYVAAIDEPDEIRRLMEYLLQNAFILMDFYMDERVMYVNNGAVDLGNSSYPFTDRLPSAAFNGIPATTDMFLRTDSQETLSMSPDMLGELIFPYYRRLCERGGLWYYGCCEPVHPVWGAYISRIPNIKKASVSKWCDEAIMGPALTKSGVVYSRKLDALFLGGGPGLDAEGLAAYVRATMRHAGGCQIEFISREIASLYGNTAKLRQATDIMRTEISRALGA